MLSLQKRRDVSRRPLDASFPEMFSDTVCFLCFQNVVLGALVALALSLPARGAAPEQRQFSHYLKVQYDTEQGLPQDVIHGIAQTPDGFMWFGTRDGLARFDGIRFTIFRSEDNPGLAHNVIGRLMADHLGRLWIATVKGLSCYQHGKFRSYGHEDGFPESLVHAMLEDSSGKLWFGTSRGLTVSDGVHFHTFTSKDGLPQSVILALAEDRNGGIWIGTEGGLAFLKDGSFHVYTARDGLPSDEVDNLLVDHLGRLWVATEQGFARMVGPGHFEKIRELHHGNPWYLLEDKAGNVWASSTISLAWLAPGKVQFQEEPINAGEAPIAMFEDRNGSLWLATTHAGLLCYRRQPSARFTSQDGLIDNFALNFFEDSRRGLWIGTAGGLSRRSQGVIRPVPAFNSLAVGEVQAFGEDHEHRIWIGTSNGLVRFDGKRWERMRSSPVPLPLNIGSLCVDRNDRIWIGSTEGLFIWDHGALSRFTVRQDLPGTYISAIAEDKQGMMWVATDSGLAAIEGRKLAAFYTTENGLLSNIVTGLFTSSDGALWISSFNGLNCWRNGHLQVLTMKQGLPTQVLHLVEDDYGYFWIASYRGIFRIQREDLEKLAEPGQSRFIPSYEHWGPEDGFRIGFSNPPNQAVIWKAWDGVLWFATKDGIVAGRPSDLQVPFSTPEPLVYSFLVDGESVAARDLKPGVRRVEFGFTAPTSHAPEQLQFRYRLDGFDHDWHDAPRQRSASFTNLPRGRYLFRVLVKRTGGSWNPNEAHFAFQIQPHWYETTTFRIICGLAIVLMLWSAHALRLRQTRRGLRLVMAERSRVAQELHDTLLQSVSGTAMEIQGGLRQISLGASQLGVEQVSKALDHLGKSMGDARQAIWDLRSPESSALTISGAMEAAQRLCVGGPELTLAISGAPKELPKSIEKQAYRIAVEAVTNAVRHSGCSDVTISVEFKDKSIVLAVADNGCGFDFASAQSASISNHWGLAVMQERAQACSGTLKVQSARGKGTRIVFEAPLGETA